MGPVSVSARGRVGAHVGPFSASAGGRGNGEALAAIVGIAIVFAVFTVVVWPLCLIGHAIGLVPSWHQLLHRDHAWMHQHYALVGVRFVAVAALLIALLVGLMALVHRVEAPKRARLPAEQEAEDRRAPERVARQRAQAADRKHAAHLRWPPRRHAWTCRPASRRAGCEPASPRCTRTSSPRS